MISGPRTQKIAKQRAMKQYRAIAIAAVLLGSAVVFAQNHAQAAPQAQESSAQKLLMHSIEMLDVEGVRTALDEGADPNYTKFGFSMIGTLATRSNLTYNPARHPSSRTLHLSSGPRKKR